MVVRVFWDRGGYVLLQIIGLELTLGVLNFPVIETGGSTGEE
jgi:hypothetical protein